MKSIRQIFKNNLDLLDEPEVQELIEYTQELEGQVLDTKIEKQYDHQDVLLMMIRDIHKHLQKQSSFNTNNLGC